MLSKTYRKILVGLLYWLSAGAILGIYGVSAQAIAGISFNTSGTITTNALANQLSQIAGQSFTFVDMIDQNGEEISLNLTTQYLLIGSGENGTFVGIIDKDGFLNPYYGSNMLQNNPNPLPAGLIKKEGDQILIGSYILPISYVKIYKYFPDNYAIINITEGNDLTLYVLKNDSIKTITVKTEGSYTDAFNGTQDTSGWYPATVISQIQPDRTDTFANSGPWDAQVEYNVQYADLYIHINNTEKLVFYNIPLIGLSNGGSTSSQPAQVPKDFNEILKEIQAIIVQLTGLGLAVFLMLKGIREIGISI